MFIVRLGLTRDEMAVIYQLFTFRGSVISSFLTSLTPVLADRLSTVVSFQESNILCYKNIIAKPMACRHSAVITNVKYC